MIRDPFYSQIVDRLGKRLDPEEFERCAADLLRRDFPTLVPIRGGSDSGRDGAIADGNGRPFPLVSTTGKDVIGNLTRSLDSYLADGGTRRVVVLATSSALTPKQRSNLEKRAQDKGFTLVQIYEQAAMADRLYRDPRWCRELLGLTGHPSALSILPVTNRPMIGETLIGRDADLEWLETTPGDKVVLGHPGSGKTFLLRTFAKRTGGLFVIDSDLGRIAEALRAQQPTSLIVDDAHVALGLLTKLKQLREELGAQFSIVATSWLGGETLVVEALGISSRQARRLPLLTRDEIVQVVASVGLRGSRELVKEIADQAEGRPGLAVTLAHLCIEGSLREVALGEALSRAIQTTFERLVGERSVSIVAAIAVAGDSGLTMTSVAQFLDVPLAELQRSVIGLAAGGVIKEASHDRLSVRPPVLRSFLVRDVFFCGAKSLPIDPLLKIIDHPRDAVRTLIQARHRGANVPDRLIRPLLVQANSSRAWAEYAWLGPSEASYVLTGQLKPAPDFLGEVALAALYHIPEEAIPRLLDAAVGDNRQLHSTPSQPLRILTDWVKATYPGRGEVLPRRRTLAAQTAKWLSAGGDATVGAVAFAAAVDPGFEIDQLDPGSGRQLTMTRGLLTPEELGELEEVWGVAIDMLDRTPNVKWQALVSVLNGWAYPEVHTAGSVPREIALETRRVARRMLRDYAERVRSHPGLVRIARKMSAAVGAPISTPIDREYEILYPPREPEDWGAEETRQSTAARRLARTWSRLDVTAVIDKIERIEQEAELANQNWPRLTLVLCDELAQRVDNLREWAQMMMDRALAPELFEPFLRRVVQLRTGEWETLIEQALALPHCQASAISVVLTEPDVPKAIVGKAIAIAEPCRRVVYFCCLGGQVPESTLFWLLNAESDLVAGSAALGLWSGSPLHAIPLSLSEAWRAAVFRAHPDEHVLGIVLKAHPEMAAAWLDLRASHHPAPTYRTAEADKSAVAALDDKMRRALFAKLPKDAWARDIIEEIVSNSPGLYRDLLDNEQLSEFHLDPLGIAKEVDWQAMVQCALEHGYSADDVLQASIFSSHGWSGPLSSLWSDWIDRLISLQTHPEPELRMFATRALEIAQRSREKALADEREEDIYGL